MDVLYNNLVREEAQSSCESHGEFTAKLLTLPDGRKLWTGCPMCEKEAEEAEEKRQKQERKKQTEKNYIASLFKAACIPPRFKGKTIEGWETSGNEKQEKVKEICLEYAENFKEAQEQGRSLIFCGKVGTGKTHLATGIANRLIEQRYTALFMSVINAVRRVRETYSRDSEETENEVIDHFLKPDLLILDEVGQQRGTQDEKMIIYDIINRRYENIKPMILISNLSIEGIKEDIGERAFDRLREGGGRAITFDWGSYRE